MKNQIERAEPDEFKEAAYRLENTIRLLRTEQKASIEALRRYGKHLTGCACFDEFDEKACDCGFGKYEVGERAEPSRGAPDARRKAFEEWAAEAYGGDISKYLVRDPLFPEEYKPADIQWAWKAWEESANRANSGHVVLLEALRGYQNSHTILLSGKCECFLCAEAEAAIKQTERT